MEFKEIIDPDWKELKSWKTYHNYMKKVSLKFLSILSTGLGLFLSTIQVSAQPLVKDPPGTPDGVDISINPVEPLPANGTVSISTEGATNTDMNGFPPEGVSVIISSDTVTITNQAVDIATADGDGDEEGGNGGDEDTADEVGEEDAGDEDISENE